MSRLHRALLVLSLASCSAYGQVSSESCPSARQCSANCSIAFNSHWRYGSPGLQADMEICEEHCMARNPNCSPAQTKKAAQPGQRSFQNLEPAPQERQYWEKGK